MRMGMRVCARVRRKYLFVIKSCVPPLLNELQVCVRMRMRVGVGVRVRVRRKYPFISK